MTSRCAAQLICFSAVGLVHALVRHGQLQGVCLAREPACQQLLPPGGHPQHVLYCPCCAPHLAQPARQHTRTRLPLHPWLQIEIWKVKRLIKALDNARGNGTSMISLIMPPKSQVTAACLRCVGWFFA